MKQQFTLRVNGRAHSLSADPETPLLYVLRNILELNGPKFGCGLEQCGACMVLLDETAAPSCRLAVSQATKYQIRTLEGLAEEDGKLHKVQQAFMDEQAAQCGYCLNGLVIASVSLLSRNPKPSDQEIREGLARNLCRCGIHSRVLKAVKRAASE